MSNDVVAAAAQQLTSIAPSLRLRRSWIEETRSDIEASSSPAIAANKLLELLVRQDIRDTCDGSLPPDLDRCNGIHVQGSHFLQLLQAVDISKPQSQDVAGMEQDHLEDGSIGAHQVQGSSMLKVCFSDGVQRICGIERRPIAALRHAKPGMKVVLSNSPPLRRGLLLLEPQHLEVVGLTSFARAIEGHDAGAQTAPRSTHHAVHANAAGAPHVPEALRTAAAPVPPRALTLSAGRRVDASAANLAPASRTDLQVLALTGPSQSPDSSHRMAGTPGGMTIELVGYASEHPPRQPGVQITGHAGSTREVTARFYVCEARSLPADGAQMWMRLCDGLGTCEAMLCEPLLSQLLPAGSRDAQLKLATMLHGIFQLRMEANSGGRLNVVSFSRGPELSELEEHLQVLHAHRRSRGSGA